MQALRLKAKAEPVLSPSQSAPILNEPENSGPSPSTKVAMIDELPPIDLDVMLADFNWHAGGDAAALEGVLFSELQALEAANLHDIIQSEERANAVVEQIEQSIKELNHIEEWLNKYTTLLQVSWLM